MFLEENTVDDLMHKIFSHLLVKPFNVATTRGKKLGSTSEEIGNLLVLKNPLARLSRSETRGKPFSALGEFLWYLSKSNDADFIKYYISAYCDEIEDDDMGRKIVYGGYGPRLFKMRGKYDQIDRVIDLLKKKPTSRKAVIQLFDVEDLHGEHKDIPCTCFLQCLVRDDKLNLIASMRSNDAFLGFPHDVFCFTMLQELIARELGLDLGHYYHSVSSLHLYERHKENAEAYINEGWQPTLPVMPNMPNGSQAKAIETVLSLEENIRLGTTKDLNDSGLDSYWLDLVRLLQIHSLRRNHTKKITQVKSQMSSEVYNLYIDKKLGQE